MGVNTSLIPSIISYNSTLLSSISYFTSFNSSINFQSIPFCSSKIDCLFFISPFSSSLRFKATFNSLNHSSASAYSSSLSANKCFFQVALHIIYLCKAGKLKFTIYLKYQLIVFLLSFPVAPILDLKLSIISLICFPGS